MKVWMSLNFGQIPLLTTKLAALEYLKTTLSPGFQCNFYSDLITRTGIISYVFEFIPGHCFKFRVICL